MKFKITLKNILLFFLWFACIIDILTAITGPIQFEANPIYLWTSSIWVLILVKVGICIGLTYLLKFYKPNPKTTKVFSYMIILMIVYSILLQFVGAYSNVQVNSEYEKTVGTDQEIQPMESNKAVLSYFIVILIVLYIPLIISCVAFFICEKIYLKY